MENIRQSVETITKRQETTATACNASCLSSCVVLSQNKTSSSSDDDDNDEDGVEISLS